jgi:hypothetical protein
MSENFESTYESMIPSDNPVFVNSGLKGGNDEIFFTEFNKWDEDYHATLNVGNYFSDGSPDTISFQTTTTTFGNDHLTFNPPSNFTITMTEDTNKNGFWKYEEDKTLKEIEQYLSSTYHSHYTSETSKTQTLDLIESIGDAEAFTRSNAIKYLSRFGKKNGKSKQDILKAIHYCILLYHFAGLHKNTTSDFPY